MEGLQKWTPTPKLNKIMANTKMKFSDAEMFPCLKKSVSAEVYI